MLTNLSSVTPKTVNPPASGRLVLVVGPSGCGKDTLLDAARLAFASDRRVYFARRDITRSSTAGGENHREVSAAEFERNLKAGLYPLHWDAHQLRYGILDKELAPLEKDEVVILNGSRSVLDDVLDFHANTRVISIRVQHNTLENRLRSRGREEQEAINKRLLRATAFDVTGSHVIEIWNDGTVEEGTAAFLEAMTSAMA